MIKVCILDYGSGNVKSVFNLLSSLIDDVVVSNEPIMIAYASHIILPGVGAFGSAMRKIKETLPLDTLEQEILTKKKPFLGICVGMQVMASIGVEFGEHSGLGWIEGRVDKMEIKGLPLPHVGWNNVISKKESPLLEGLGNDPDFYFVHSYAFNVKNPESLLASTIYGEEFCSVIQHENLFGVQFHPEKSQLTGIKLMKNFLSIS